MEYDFSGKRALVTGGSRGIGKEIVKKLIEDGAEVFALSKTQENLDALKKENPSVNVICVDVADWNATRKSVEEIGVIDFLVNNAGVIDPGNNSFEGITEEYFDWIYSINVKPVINISQIVIRKLKEEKKPGSIINMSSVSSVKYVGEHIYSSTKAAMDRLTKSMAVEFGSYNIRVNSVNPAIVYTDMVKVVVENPVIEKECRGKIPMRKFCCVEDIADTVIFLLSDKAKMINGVILPVDGGIGKEVVKQLIKYGAEVFALGQNEGNLNTLKTEIPSVNVICVDVGDWNATRKAVEGIGVIDFLVNNAGMTEPRENFTLELLAEEDFDRVISVNVKPIINISQIVIKKLKEEQKPGSIVNISSVASMKHFGAHAYSSSKAAMDRLTKSMAVEFGPQNIRVNSVNPTVVYTDMAKWAIEDPDTNKLLKEAIPLKKFCTVEDIANAVTFLLSDRARMISGVILPIDGAQCAT